MAKVLQIQMNPYDSFSDLCERSTSALVEDGNDVTVAFLKGEYDKNFPSKAKEIKEFRFHKSSLKGLKRIFSIYALFRFIQKEKFDIVIGHRFKPIHMLLTVAPFLDTSIIGVVHGEGDYNRGYRRRVIKKRGKHAAKFIAVSESVLNHLFELNCGFDAHNTEIIYNSIDVDKVKDAMLPKSAARESLGVDQDSFLFGTIGRLVPVKGHESLIDAFAILLSKYPSSQLVIIGEGRSRDDLEKQINSKGIGSQIHLLGWRDEPARFLSAFDCYVFPSLSEGLPLGLLEGMCASICITGSDIPAIRPIIEPFGLLHKPGDAGEIRKSLEAVLAMTKKERDTRGSLALSKVSKEYSLMRFNRSWTQCIDKVFKERGR